MSYIRQMTSFTLRKLKHLWFHHLVAFYSFKMLTPVVLILLCLQACIKGQVQGKRAKYKLVSREMNENHTS